LIGVAASKYAICRACRAFRCFAFPYGAEHLAMVAIWKPVAASDWSGKMKALERSFMVWHFHLICQLLLLTQQD